MFDIGVNLTSTQFAKDREQVVKRAREAGVTGLLITVRRTAAAGFPALPGSACALCRRATAVVAKTDGCRGALLYRHARGAGSVPGNGLIGGHYGLGV